ncbi:FtsW/RodA/SpoVE family cell cycle protein [Parablautia sp. Marseille-Q6255]|uniref:FtsW/RodA/SpoVE family cell cycle protein n=1 Tax=Parablautia sp. Marseille-Q6255 TaxID=3039593 RepID=UPI0024BC322F|nr:putative peptidoglycan glycosyltransferase FtsW [Parablautia sp. Marseille-Q6255]
MQSKSGKTDGILFVLVLFLTAFGLVVLYSMSAYNGQVRFGDSAYYFKKQFFAVALGLVVMCQIAALDYHVLLRFSVPAYMLSLVLSGAVLLFGDAYNGSRRWLSIGPLSFQPAEYAKPAVILLLAGIVGRMDYRKSGRMIGAVLLLVLPVIGLVGTNNLSTAVIILGIAVLMIFLSNPRYLPFLWIVLAGSGFLGIFLSLESYRLERLAIWRNPELYEKGYQTMQGLYAIGSGGLFGRGLGNSLQKLGFVPEAQNDMIFAVICEEMGLIGALLLMLLFLLLIWRFMVIATHAPDLSGTLIAAGILGHIALQVILNIAVVTNTIPNTGITLPFISYGGTSVLFLLSEMGLALSVSRHCSYPGKR